jgi:hypothetical protein
MMPAVDGNSPLDVASRYLPAVDLTVRDLLLVATTKLWTVPDDSRKRARKSRSLNLLVSLAESYAPPSVDRNLLVIIRDIYHPIRNEIEHEGRKATFQEASDYLSLVERLAFSIIEPSFSTLPETVLQDLDGYELIGTTKVIRGQGTCPWYVVHGRQASHPWDNHIFECWQHRNGMWSVVMRLDFGQWDIARMERVQTRSASFEEVMVWGWRGLGAGTSSWQLISFEDDTVIRLIERDEIPGCFVRVISGRIEEFVSGRVRVFEWDGLGYESRILSRQMPSPVNVKRITYSVQNGKVVGPSLVQVPLGKEFYLSRTDTEDIPVRMLGLPTDVIEQGFHGTRGAKPGKTEVMLIPNLYDERGMLTITVEVVGADEDWNVE